METIKIFLASSSELESDREQFEIFINRENNKYIEEDIFLKLVLWEDFLDAMSQTRLQDEYNKAVADCDVFVSLFYTKVGKYTAEDFEKAFKTFQGNNKPLIYTYFKDAAINTSKITLEIMSLLNFKQKLDDLEHFYTNYTDINDLKFQFSNQLKKFIPQLTGISLNKNEKPSDNVVTDIGNVESNQNSIGVNTRGDLEENCIKASDNPKLKYIQNQKKQIDSQISILKLERLLKEYEYKRVELELKQDNLSKDIVAENTPDLTTELITRYKKNQLEMINLFDEKQKVEEEIKKLELNPEEFLPNISFGKALETFEFQFNKSGDLALFFIDDSSSKRGDLFLKKLENKLKPKTYPFYRNNFYYCTITYTSGKLEGLIQEIATFFEIKQKEATIESVIKEISKSLQRNSVLLIDINCDIDDESDLDPLIPWFVNEFWKPLSSKTKEVIAEKEYCGIKIVAVISSNIKIDERRLTEKSSDYLNNDCSCFKNDKLAKIPLVNWTEDDIKKWLFEYSHPSLTIRIIKRKASRVFNESSHGIPSLVCEALQQQWQILTHPNTFC